MTIEGAPNPEAGSGGAGTAAVTPPEQTPVATPQAQTPGAVKQPMEEKPTVEDLEAEGYSDGEIELAKKQKLVKDEGNGGGQPTPAQTGQPAPTTGTSPELGANASGGQAPAPAGQQTPAATPPAAPANSLDEFLKDRTPDEELSFVKGISTKEFALYSELRKNRARRQSAESERDFFKVKLSAIENKLNSLPNKAGESPENQLEFGSTGEPKPGEELPDDTPLTKGDLKKMQQQNAEAQLKQEREARELSEKMTRFEGEAMATDPNFKEVIVMADEIMAKDESQAYSQALLLTARNADPQEAKKVVNLIYQYAKLHPEYAQRMAGSAQPTAQPKANAGGLATAARILKNAGKTSSAGLSSGSGGGKLAEEDITVETIGNYSNQEKWDALKPETRKRLLKQISEMQA